MTDTRSFGRILGETARAAQRAHHAVLAKAGTDFPSWVAFTLLAEHSPAMPKDALAADLARRLEIDPAAGQQILDRLAAAGHVAIRGDATIALTASGEAHLRRVRTAVEELTQQLIGHLDERDLAIAARVLRAMGERADALAP